MVVHPLDHPVSRYAQSVIEGDILTGELARLACERHLMDLETAKDRGLFFDCEAADMIANFANMLTHTAGPKAGRALTLEPWQEFRMGSVFGWKREADGLRRYRQTYHQVGKKNGKTTDTSVPMLFNQLFDGESSPEGYCAATTRDQAGILFKTCKRIIRRSPVLARYLKVYNSTILTPRNDGQIVCLSRDGNSADGINPSFVARDEMHRWTDRELAETIVESTAARSQPIDWVITTAGHDRRSLCYELREYGEKVLRGDVDDDQFFAYIAEPDADCDPADPAAWAMGNPNMGVSKAEEFMRLQVMRAQAIQGRMPNFKRFHLNLWTEGEQTWIGREAWDAGGMSQPFDPAMLRGRAAWVGVDLSRTTDTTAIVAAIPVDGLIYLLAYTFIPEGPKGFARRAQAENREFIGWRDNGWLEVHRGPTINQDEVVRRIQWLSDNFDLQEVAYDPWGMGNIAKELDKRRFPMVEHRQGSKSMSDPIKRFEEAVLTKRMRHGGNPVLAWSLGNVVLDMDKAENLSPNKKKATGRIDTAVAAIMAVGRAEANERKRRTRETEVV